jgi:hypothetical protein
MHSMDSAHRTDGRANETVLGARLLEVGLLAIAAGLVVVALLGPLGTEVVHYRVTETLRNQTIGLDAVSLVIVAPLSALAAYLASRGRAAGPAMAMGIGAYTSYMFLQYIVGPDYGHLSGNNEKLFPLAVSLFAAGWIVALGGWLATGDDRLPVSPERERRVGRYALPALAALAFVRYVPALADWMSGSPTDGGYLAGPTFAWTIATLDLGVFLPITVATCVGLTRGAVWARRSQWCAGGSGWSGLPWPRWRSSCRSTAIRAARLRRPRS